MPCHSGHHEKELLLLRWKISKHINDTMKMEQESVDADIYFLSSDCETRINASLESQKNEVKKTLLCFDYLKL